MMRPSNAHAPGLPPKLAALLDRFIAEMRVRTSSKLSTGVIPKSKRRRGGDAG